MACIVCAVAACAAAADRPAVHVLAPSQEYGIQYDALIAESALRLVVMELAARHGVYARFWASDQLDGLDNDAYPRLRVSGGAFPRVPYLRLRRRGDLFDLYGSPRGKRYVHLARYCGALPDKTYVGVMLPATWTPGKSVTGSVSELRLNGQPLSGYYRADIGQCDKPNEVSREGDKHILTAHSFTTDSDYRERGPFLYKPCQGDFEIEGHVHNVISEGGHYGLALMCRDGLKLDSNSVGLYAPGQSPYGGLGGGKGTRVQNFYDLGAHAVVVELVTSAGKAERLAWVPTTCVSWAQVVDSVGLLTDEVLAGLREKGIVPKSAPAGARPPTEAQLKALGEARALALQVNSGKVLEAARKVDEVLDASPVCPSAHFTAGLCRAMLACQDVYGAFYERPRFLAGAVAHVLLCHRLGGSDHPGDRLSEAWVRLACGYPRAAEELRGSCPPDAQKTAEALALKMFLTQDYRRLTEKTVLSAEPIEQWAWVYATSSCARSDLLQEVPSQLARRARTCALLPLYRGVGVGPGHLYSHLRVNLAFARDASDLLRCPDLPARARRAAGERMARALGKDAPDDLDALAQTVAWAAVNEGLDKDLAGALSAVTDLYAAAMERPVGPVREGGKFRWRSVSLHDFADVQRGLLVRTVWRKSQFLGSMLSVPVRAEEFCRQAAGGLEKVPGAKEFFNAVGPFYLRKNDQARARLREFLATRHGRSPAGVTWAAKHFGKLGISAEYSLPPGRGTWAWQKLCEISGNLDWRRVQPYGYLALGVDDHAKDVLDRLAWRARSVDIADRFRTRMNYDSGLMTNVAYYAWEFGQRDRARAIYERMIELCPGRSTPYRNLAHLFYGSRQRAKAIELCRRAYEKCEYTVGVSNLLGTMARWLIEEDRPVEALKWGKIAAGSYSATGLTGLGFALAANRRVEEATDVLRSCARRYASGANGLTELWLQENLDLQKLSDEITKLLRLHESMRAAVAWSVARGCLNSGGNCEALAQLYEGPLSFVPPDEQNRHLMMNAMYQRRFDQALDYGFRVAARERLSPEEAILAHLARRLTKTRRETAWIDEQLRLHVEDRLLGKIVKCCLGEIPWGQLPADAQRKEPRAYRHLLKAVEAERSGNTKAAISAYEDARWVIAPCPASRVPRRWLELLQPKTSATRPTVGPSRPR